MESKFHCKYMVHVGASIKSTRERQATQKIKRVQRAAPAKLDDGQSGCSNWGKVFTGI